MAVIHRWTLSLQFVDVLRWHLGNATDARWLLRGERCLPPDGPHVIAIVQGGALRVEDGDEPGIPKQDRARITHVTPKRERVAAARPSFFAIVFAETSMLIPAIPIGEEEAMVTQTNDAERVFVEAGQ